MSSPSRPTLPAIRVALIGFGYVGRTFHAPLIEAVEGLELVCVASSDAAKVHAWRADLAVEPDYLRAATAPDIDLVVIATPNDSHHPLARAALRAGKAVVIDKPFTVTLAEAEDLVALAEARGALLSVFHNRRWDGDFLGLRAAIDGGTLGEVRELVSRFDRFSPAPRDRWRERPGPGAGLWFDLGPHVVDQVLQLFGPPETVCAQQASLRDGGQGVDDWTQVVLGYGAQRRVTLHVTRLAAWQAPRFEAHGTRGSWLCSGLDIQEDQLKAGMAPGAPGWGEDARPALQADAQGAVIECPRPAGDYRAYYAGIRDALRGRAPNPVPPREALAVMALMDCVTRSAAEGRTLRFGAG
ncbi:oxidoreductase [Sphaerotilus natans]|uniref:oxidoreductase n=1 Tax=Sphaerotilus natans TaxID=34103 RepID=UPI00406CEC83